MGLLHILWLSGASLLGLDVNREFLLEFLCSVLTAQFCIYTSSHIKLRIQSRDKICLTVVQVVTTVLNPPPVFYFSEPSDRDFVFCSKIVVVISRRDKV